jgi:hypothetical protein
MQFRSAANTLVPLEQQATEMFKLARYLSAWSPLLSRWYLSTGHKKDSLSYEAFDANGPTAAALAKWRKEEAFDIRSLSVWNGANKDSDSAGISSRYNVLGRPNSIEFRLRVNPAITDWRQGSDLIRFATAIWPSLFATFSPFWYDGVFKDRPGVGWMLYLPCVLTVEQVPEARALEPVMGKDAQGKEMQTGTIIVSVTDEPFSDENPEHVRIANSIEIRLVDQDLLPRYADL